MSTRGIHSNRHTMHLRTRSLFASHTPTLPTHTLPEPKSQRQTLGHGLSHAWTAIDADSILTLRRHFSVSIEIDQIQTEWGEIETRNAAKLYHSKRAKMTGQYSTAPSRHIWSMSLWYLYYTWWYAAWFSSNSSIMTQQNNKIDSKTKGMCCSSAKNKYIDYFTEIYFMLL